MPAKTEIERRDRALVAFTILTGARDQAIVSFKLKHIDVEHELLEQDDRQVLTKRAKTFTTWFFPIGDAVQQIVVERVTFLRAEKGFGPEDPIFPKARVEMGPDLSLRGKTVFNARIGSVPKGRFAIFQSALVPQQLVQLAYELKLNAEQFKAWSQNLGHEQCLTTFSSWNPSTA